MIGVRTLPSIYPRRGKKVLVSGSIGKLGKKMLTKLGLLPLLFNASLQICLGKARDLIRQSQGKEAKGKPRLGRRRKG
jgi:hypothetical protein